MRAAPPLQVSLTRFGVWRTAVALLTVLGAAVLIAWLTMRPRDAWIDAAMLLSLCGLIAVARSLMRVAPVDLRWSGLVWTLAPAGQPPEVAQAGDLQVVIDLGAWMLLRFDSLDGVRTWLPAQRSGLATQWHALRCTVHAPRPMADVATR